MPIQYSSEYYQRNKSIYKKASDKWRKKNLNKRAEYQREYNKKNPRAMPEIAKKWRENNPQKQKAYSLSQALPKKKQCENCGSSEQLERHHPDYSKSRKFITLCKSCHLKKHEAH